MKALFRKHALFPTVIALIALVCFVAVAALFILTTVQPPLVRLSLLLLPTLLLGAVAVSAAKGRLSPAATTAVTVLLSIVLVILSGIYVLHLTFTCALTATTDPVYYPRALAQIDPPPSVQEVFPAAIPEEAGEVDFLYQAAVLQGGETFRLSCTLPSTTIAEWKSRLEKAARWIGADAAWYAQTEWSDSGEDGATRYHLYWDEGYNHGEWAYVLLYPAQNRLVFVYEDW